ncbi:MULTISPECIES: MBL fold metallo-hydrolase [unclassified Bradyrhizobium]|uniref:MBL fold metallo-hydrolase n=1 Tax=unclassified Bradyrhizobium TaxID=2631580 RepID=UPI0028E9D2C6|nr:MULTISPECIES: MBL fold metallo-hydrolase [unclassified Bradyrhizobium]
MSTIENAMAVLNWSVTTVKRAGLSRELPSGNPELMWVANSSTLIYGERDSVLVDTFLTAGQSKTLLDWVASFERNLTAIYVTHGHGDHFFGLAPLLDRFPNARALAVPEVVAEMKAQLKPASLDGFWRKRFPGEIAERLLAAEPLEGELQLEGHKLVVVDMGRTDTARSTALHVPSLDLIVAGDTVYNGIHPYLAETNTQSRLEWIASLDRLEALKPRFVIAGHKKPDNDDDPRNIAETRQYLLDFNRLDQATASPRELYEAMLELYPDRANPGSLWSGANVAKERRS